MRRWQRAIKVKSFPTTSSYLRNSALGTFFTNSLRLLRLCSLVTVVYLVGCGERKPSVYPVTLTVTYPDKKPVAGAQIALLSEQHKTTARGSTGTDGTCRVTTYQSEDGAAPGPNKVIVAKPQLIGDPDKPYTGPQIADKYASAATSGLEVVVTDDESKNSFPITITPH